ncbi:MAG TPA: hypothetical protein VF103_11880, partial [Polyangiaceae bacterium]
MLLYGVSVTFAACAITLSLGRSWQTGVALLAASAVLVILVRFTGYFGSMMRAGRPGARTYDSTTERLRSDLPVLLQALERSRSEQEILDVLRGVGDACTCEQVEVRTDTGSRRLASTSPEPAAGGRRSYPLGPDIRARARVELVWESIDQQPSPQAGILVQIVVDAAAQALGRCSSPLAPETEAEAAVSSRPPGMVIVPNSSRA